MPSVNRPLGPIYIYDFFRTLCSYDSFVTSFPIGFNVHFIAKQSQEAEKLQVLIGP